ncbi:menaquinone biosynthetic enzyme MqnA/MqnD family protein [Alkalicoccobacillus porphyridii]|uniref:Chorismate dehydratase n=1 Tax=Alkalicoccobacillus porphyridii TaxID=2597270 RepID=A0A553ZZN4_9BACI|nr:menaquinone biosynthesis protein [Alkalicoccobacillus porphyridii]TSB46910.1 menaquinone biosynthesis protein [Alkalicoccobacillus porphyridii]
MTLRIGEIEYANIQPFFHKLNRKQLGSQGFELITNVPSRINEELAAGRLDVAGISSFSYAEHADEYSILPDISVSSKGEVRSLLLFSKVPIEKLNEKTIALTASSATTIHLLKIMLHFFYDLQVQYVTMKPQLHSMLDHHDAALLIGDDAIRAARKTGDLHVYDLGELWYQHTGLPMTYALFAVRKEVLHTQTNPLETVYQSLLDSREQTKEDNYRQLAEHFSLKQGGTFHFWQSYFQNLWYHFNEENMRGLLYYYKLAYEYGFLSKSIHSISVWNKIHS